MKRNLIIGIIVVVSASVASVSYVFLQKQKKNFTAKVGEFSKEKSAWQDGAKALQELLSKKDNELNIVRKQNFQQDLQVAQSALREANEKLGAVVKEKGDLENSNLILDNRLRNTSNELTKTLEELKKARTTLGGIEGQYKTKIAQLSDSVRLKDEQLQKLQSKVSEKDSAATGLQKQGKEYSDSLRKFQVQMSELEGTISSLKKSLSDKEKMLAQKDAEIDKYKRIPGYRSKAQAGLEEDKTELEKQISTSSAKLFDQQEQLKNLEDKVVVLQDTLAQREALLVKKGDELKDRKDEVESLKQEMKDLESSSKYVSKSEPILSATQRELEAKVRQLERDKSSLEDRLDLAQSKSLNAATGKTKDPFADRNFRVLTEALVRKEEQINQMEKELESLRRQVGEHDSGSGLKERRLAELEILVSTLTKQLGEYAGLITEKETQLKSAQVKVDSLMQEIEAQKIASIALQKELAEAKNRQEKTFQSLTQIMGLNSGPNIAPIGSSADASNTAGEVSSEESSNPNSQYQEAAAEVEPKVVSGADAKKKADELRRRVEVLLEGK